MMDLPAVILSPPLALRPRLPLLCSEIHQVAPRESALPLRRQ